jgi:acetyl-CoA C-acetyltransferase
MGDVIRDTVICEPVRTPIGRYGGMLTSLTAIGRVVALDAGLPVTVPGMQLDRRCGSDLQAMIQACMQVGTGQDELVVAGGAESMSNVDFHSTDMRWGGARGGVKFTTHSTVATPPPVGATTRCSAA